MTDSTTGPDQVTGATPDNAIRNADRAEDGPVLAADGKPLKASLHRALRREKLRALGLIAPLLIFVLVTFIAPIADMLFRSVENQIVTETLPRTVAALDDWDGQEVPDERVFDALARDMIVAVEEKTHTRLGSRLNYETTGISSLFRQTGRDVDDVGELYADQFIELDEAWEDPMTWATLMGSEDYLSEAREWQARADEGGMFFDEMPPSFELRDGVSDVLPQTSEMFQQFARVMREQNGEAPTGEEPWNITYLTLYEDLSTYTDAADRFSGQSAELIEQAAQAVDGFETTDMRQTFLDIDEDWGSAETWGTIEAFSSPYTSGYFLAAADLQLTPDGVERQPEDQRIYGLLFKRTLFMSMVIMFSCIALGYPIAYLLSNLPMRTSNLLLILVLLPFWTSLLVRTSAWKVLLQQQGVINDVLVWIGIVGDDARLQMINNQFGTIVAMTHILLPFMILPLYSVMKTIPPSYMRAAKSLGATNFTAFRRVYFPQSIPGIGAGCILVFILSIGYYITPELVGGTTGTFISNRIAYHISTSLNWGLAAALGSILLVVVVVLYWLYDRIVGIDNVSLG
ncbi:ABC transporter permease [Tranquillimonas rosea]|uniref:ABC transporter permease n=1 Tax=Tranquillimonas rosea TaxID=641238 RepID=UPI003BAB2DE3